VEAAICRSNTRSINSYSSITGSPEFQHDQQLIQHDAEADVWDV
jgi:hypothetical protein